MNELIRKFNQNRDEIIKMISVIVFGLGLLYFFNSRAAKESEYLGENAYNQQYEQVYNENINTNSATSVGAFSNTSSDTKYETETDKIEEFFKNCNEANTTAAYNMLSKQCKENMYPTEQNFIKNYYNNNFETNKIYNIQRWTSSTYKVDLKENMLQTGKIETESKQDYITIVKEDGEYKLNINNYIGRTELNSEQTEDKLKIKVLYKDTHMDYETYTLKIENNSDTEIYLDNLEKTSTIYLVDENEIKHTAHTHKIAKEDLHIYAHTSKTIKITFSNRFISDREISRLVFENIIINNEQNNNITINLEY